MFEGVLLTPGRNPEGLIFLEDHKVIYQDQYGTKTCKHGNWSQWKLNDGVQILTVTFSNTGSEAVDVLEDHHYSEIVAGIYRIKSQMQIIVFREDFGKYNYGRNVYLNLAEDIVENTEDMFLWLHPGRDPAVLLFTHQRQIMYHVLNCIHAAYVW